jgi:hypothetical protein
MVHNTAVKIQYGPLSMAWLIAVLVVLLVVVVLLQLSLRMVQQPSSSGKLKERKLCLNTTYSKVMSSVSYDISLRIIKKSHHRPSVQYVYAIQSFTWNYKLQGQGSVRFQCSEWRDHM